MAAPRGDGGAKTRSVHQMKIQRLANHSQIRSRDSKMAGRVARQTFRGRPIRDEYLIVDAGKLAGTGAHSYSAGDATGGSDTAARFTT